jgi:hypothetical protein
MVLSGPDETRAPPSLMRVHSAPVPGCGISHVETVINPDRLHALATCPPWICLYLAGDRANSNEPVPRVACGVGGNVLYVC